MPTKTRIILVSILILLGGALFCYCAIFYPTTITTQAKAGSTTVTGSGPASAEATSVGSAEQDKSGQLNQTRSEGRSRPRTGAT
jgi:hypothetical protein